MSAEVSSIGLARPRVEPGEWLAAVGWLLLGIGVLIAGGGLESFTRFGPGPGFFLKWLAGALIVLSLLQGWALLRAVRATGQPRVARTIAAALTEDGPEAAGPTSVGSTLRFVAMGAALAAYALLLDRLGFVVATAGLSWATLVILDRPPLRALIESVVAVLLIRHAFVVWLDVPLPSSEIALLRLLDR